MKRLSISVLFWIILLAVPFTAIALSLAAYVTDHLFELSSSVVSFFNAPTQIGRPWLLEIAERMPEVAGMIAGQVIILIILFITRLSEKKEEA